jgi:hypothetical protein
MIEADISPRDVVLYTPSSEDWGKIYANRDALAYKLKLQTRNQILAEKLK